MPPADPSNHILLAIESARTRDTTLIPCCAVTHQEFVPDLNKLRSWIQLYGAATTAELIGLTLTCCR